MRNIAEKLCEEAQVVECRHRHPIREWRTQCVGTGSVETEPLNVSFHCGVVAAKNKIEARTCRVLLKSKTLDSYGFQ